MCIYIIWSNNTISPTWISLKQEMSLPKKLPFEGLRLCEVAITAIFCRGLNIEVWHPPSLALQRCCALLKRRKCVGMGTNNHGNPEPTFFGGLKL